MYSVDNNLKFESKQRMSRRISMVQDTLADIKRRKQMMLGGNPLSRDLGLKSQNVSKSSQYSQILCEISSLSQNIKQGQIQPQYNLVFQINMDFLSKNLKEFQNFLKSFLYSSESCFVLKQIKLFNDFSFSQTKKELESDFEEPFEDPEAKLLKLNLKYCPKSSNNYIPEQYQVNAYIFPTSSTFHLLENVVEWNSNPYIFLLQDSYNPNQSYQLYFTLLKSFSESMTKKNNFYGSYGVPKTIPPIIKLAKLQDTLQENIFSTNSGISNFLKLSQLQYNLFKAETQIKIQDSKEKIRQNFAATYAKKLLQTSIKEIKKFISFHRNRNKNLEVKYFNLWSLVTCESVLKKVDLEIIDQKYCQQKYQKQLKKKAFFNWKFFYLQLKN